MLFRSMAKYAAYGINGACQCNELRLRPWASNALYQPMKVTRKAVYDKTKPIVAKLTNHPKTITDELLATIKARHPINEGTATQYIGIPDFVQVLKILGACPSSASE